MPADPNIIKGRGESVLLACWSGRDYAEVSSLQRAMVHEAISQLEFSQDERVLDVACGDGVLTRAAARMAAARIRRQGRCLAPDDRHRARRHGADGIRPVFVVADAGRCLSGRQFDVVVSFNALHWVPEQRQARRSPQTSHS